MIPQNHFSVHLCNNLYLFWTFNYIKWYFWASSDNYCNTRQITKMIVCFSSQIVWINFTKRGIYKKLFISDTGPYFIHSALDLTWIRNDSKCCLKNIRETSFHHKRIGNINCNEGLTMLLNFSVLIMV